MEEALSTDFGHMAIKGSQFSGVKISFEERGSQLQQSKPKRYRESETMDTPSGNTITFAMTQALQRLNFHL
jgi:hypothetical protein